MHHVSVPSVLVSDTVTYFENLLLAKLTTLLGVDHRFSVANSPEPATLAIMS